MQLLLAHALTDVGKMERISEAISRARKIVKVFGRNTAAHALLEQQQQQHGVRKGLVLDCFTRFSSKFSMLESVLVNRQPLQSCVVQERYSQLSEQR